MVVKIQICPRIKGYNVSSLAAIFLGMFYGCTKLSTVTMLAPMLTNYFAKKSDCCYAIGLYNAGTDETVSSRTLIVTR